MSRRDVACLPGRSIGCRFLATTLIMMCFTKPQVGAALAYKDVSSMIKNASVWGHGVALMAYDKWHSYSTHLTTGHDTSVQSDVRDPATKRGPAEATVYAQAQLITLSRSAVVSIGDRTVRGRPPVQPAVFAA